MIPYKCQPELPDWPGEHMRRYLATNGDEGYYVDFTGIGGPPLTPTLILTTTGRKSGKPQMLPLIYGESDGKYVIVASKGGAPEHPAWYLNLVAHPEIGLQIKGDKLRARARTASGAERAQLWDMMAKIYPPYDEYQKKTEREIPVVVMEPIA